ncbi:MAG: ABC transporter ATP-binding protein [Qingshengfaniella sp.]
MLELRNLSKSYATEGGRRKVVLHPCTLALPRGMRLGLLGRNGAGKSTLLRIIAGTQDPDRGEVIRHGTVSWPIGFAGSFHGDLTGAQNTAFVARIYGVDTKALKAFVQDFAELDEFFFLPVRTYSSGMKARLAFAVSMGVPFDTYLVDEVTSVGDQRFRRKCSVVFRERLEHSGAVMVSHSMGQIKDMCTAAAVLEQGELTFFEDVSEAIDRHVFNMKVETV